MATLVHHGGAAGYRPAWLPGDRLSLARSSAGGFLWAPAGLVNGEIPLEQLTDPAGQPLTFRLDAAGGRLIVPGLSQFLQGKSSQAAVQLLYRGGGQFCMVADVPDEQMADRSWATDSGVRVALAGEEDAALLFGPVAGPARLEDFQLALRAARIGTHGSFDQLIALPLVRDMELLEHQIRTAKTVLRRFHGRALLCDEVGLGKTIEAGLVLSELHHRGLARSILVLVPPSLIEQWQGELRRKFALDFITHDDPAFRAAGLEAWQQFDRLIVSTHTAKREPHRSAITARRWDLVIVDEAHHLRNRTTQLWRFASELEKQYMLLLTATPVQNNLEELFNLVTLLEPGLLRTAKQFQKEFVDRRDKLTPKNVDQLHALLAEVMVRNRRSTVGLQFTRRWAQTLAVPPTADEAELYRRVADFVKRHLRASVNAAAGDAAVGDAVAGNADGSAEVPGVEASAKARPARHRSGISRIALVALQMALGSSARAAAGTLATLAENVRLDDAARGELSRMAEAALALPPGSKVDRLLELLARSDDKMVIFTQFRATQALLAEQLAAAGQRLAVFHGGLSRMEKEAAIRTFRGPARLLLCTEAGSEGRNLQFAHAVCNFDLPWNPMKIEQRIGRLSRIGQTHDVQVYNLVATGTIEAAVLHLLDAKLSMFELVIGEIDMILGNLDEEHEFQDVVADLWSTSADGQDFARRMDELGNRLLAAKQAYLSQRAHDDRLFGSRFSPDE